MGNKTPYPRYITGELDERVVALDRPWVGGPYICIRYPLYSDTLPSGPITLLSRELMWIPYDHRPLNKDGGEQATQVTYELEYSIFGYVKSARLVNECVYYDVPYTERYARK